MTGFTLNRFCLCTGLLLVLATMLSAAAPDAKPVFKAGFAERDISPEVGMEQPGGYGKAYHQAFHDPCKARAAVFDDGKTRVAIVGIDALFIRRQTVQTVRSAIQKRCGIEPTSMLISASHTHSGGPIGYYLPGEFDDASPQVKSLIYDHTVCGNPEYLAKVEQGIIEAVCAADAQPMTDAMALHALKLFARCLPRTKARADDLDARLECLEAVWLAASTIQKVQFGASHGIGHVLGGLCGVPHGHTSCILLPHVLGWNESANAARQELVAGSLGRPGARAADVVAALIGLLGQPRRLSEAGVKRDALPKIAEHAMENMWVRANPRPINGPHDVMEILESAY